MLRIEHFLIQKPTITNVIVALSTAARFTEPTDPHGQEEEGLVPGYFLVCALDLLRHQPAVDEEFRLEWNDARSCRGNFHLANEKRVLHRGLTSDDF